MNLHRTSGRSIATIEPLEQRQLLALTFAPIKTTAAVRFSSIQTDSAGNIFAIGEFQGTTTFDPKGTIKLTALGDVDGFIMRIAASNGATIVRRLTSSSVEEGGVQNVSPAKLLVKAGHVTVTGTLSGTVDLDPTKGTKVVESKGGFDTFVLDLSASSLAFNWATAFGSTGSDAGNGVARDSKGNTWVAGTFQDTLVFAGTPAPQVTSAGAFDAYVVKLSPTGAHLFSARIGAGGDDLFSSVAVDSKDNVVLAGKFQKTVDANPGKAKNNLATAGTTSSAMLVKLSSAGAWVGSRGFICTGFASIIDVEVDSKDGIYVLGNFDHAIDVDPTSKVKAFTSKGFGDVWIGKLDAALAPVWYYTFGADGTDQGQDIFIDTKDQLFISGSFQGTVDFNPTSAKAITTSTGGYDGFVSSYSAAGKFQGAAKIGGPGGGFVMGGARSGNSFITAVIFENVVDVVPKSIPPKSTDGSALFDVGNKVGSVIVPITVAQLGAA